MTLVICLNYGDKIYVATDSLMTSRKPNGRLLHQGYRMKLYRVQHCNAVVAFSGSMAIASRVLKCVGKYAFEKRPTETALFEELPSLITYSVKQTPSDKVQDFDILFAGLTPNSRAYDQEKYPGVGVPPKTACGVFSWRSERGENRLLTKVGKAIHVPSRSGAKFVSSDPQALMDVFVTGSGAREVIPSAQHYHYYYELRHRPKHLMMITMGEVLSGFFSEIPDGFLSELPAENPGVGGEYQVALITEEGVEIGISTASGPIRPVAIEYKHDACVVMDLATGKSDIIQTIWDPRYPYEIYEMGYLL